MMKAKNAYLVVFLLAFILSSCNKNDSGPYEIKMKPIQFVIKGNKVLYGKVYFSLLIKSQSDEVYFHSFSKNDPNGMLSEIRNGLLEYLTSNNYEFYSQGDITLNALRSEIRNKINSILNKRESNIVQQVFITAFFLEDPSKNKDSHFKIYVTEDGQYRIKPGKI